METDMEAFYAALESEITLPPSHVSLKTRPSEQTKKAIEILQDLISKEFSLLFHPGRSILMKDTLKYLFTLPPDEGFSDTTKFEILWLLQRFNQLNSDYYYIYNAGANHGSETLELLSEGVKVMNELEANAKEFRELDKEEKCLSHQLSSLQKEEMMRNLHEEKINPIKTKIADSTARRRDRVVKRKVELFHEGGLLKAKINEFWITVHTLKAEHECANIEVEWFKARDQFIRRTGFKEWI